MIISEIIAKKRDGEKLIREEIDFILQGYLSGAIPDYQMSAFLMAIFIRGMDLEETENLTWSMMNSGKILDLGFIPGIKVDKHSTGGVGDKVSLILAPLVASCGVPVPMVSGRGLGHTGGTLDKLESIPGFRTSLSLSEFIDNLKKSGVSIMGQTEEISSADGKIYALRDVTGTVNSIPLITASILSKKLTSGTDALVFDVKCGNGAFMKSREDAQNLASNLIRISGKAGRKCMVLITDMNEPLGNSTGNSLEVIESVETLKGNGPEDLLEVTLSLGSCMLILGGVVSSLSDGKELLLKKIENREGLNKFRQMVSQQGGDPRIVEDYSLFPKTNYQKELKSEKDGYISFIDTKAIGLAAVELGAGRVKLDSTVDLDVGITIKKKVGDQVKKDEVLVRLLANDYDKCKKAEERIKNGFRITKKKVKKIKKVLFIMDEKGVKKFIFN
ncbi:MAG: thymidine phosphorylase [candidate division Zixibacteria bacterium]|nr:thymidine phosphorylase [candidate division Zixibacteria bacterium]